MGHTVYHSIDFRKVNDQSFYIKKITIIKRETRENNTFKHMLWNFIKFAFLTIQMDSNTNFKIGANMIVLLFGIKISF